MTKKLSVVLATRNEEKNIEECLLSVRDIANEIIIVDEESTDNTQKIAKRLRAKVYSTKHEQMFHKTKQKALDLSSGEWILQLDADERVTDALAKEIRQVIEMDDEQIRSREPRDRYKKRLFRKHSALVDKKHLSGEIVAFRIPRLNYFLGKPIRYAGVYPDPAIRLIKKGKAYFPAKSVHENMEINGAVAWLFNDLEHHDSPTFNRYLMRFNRYTDLQSEDMKKNKTSLNYGTLFLYAFIKPLFVFLKLFIRYKGFKDGMRGFVWSLSSSLHFPIAYFKYWEANTK